MSKGPILFAGNIVRRDICPACLCQSMSDNVVPRLEVELAILRGVIGTWNSGENPAATSLDCQPAGKRTSQSSGFGCSNCQSRIRVHNIQATYIPPKTSIHCGSSTKNTSGHLISISTSDTSRSAVPDPIALPWNIKPCEVGTIKPSTFWSNC